MSGEVDRTIEQILRTLDRIVDNPDELEQWTMSIETAAKCMSDDQDGKIEFRYFPQEKIMKFFVEDPRSRDSLVKSVKIHLPIIPD